MQRKTLKVLHKYFKNFLFFFDMIVEKNSFTLLINFIFPTQQVYKSVLIEIVFTLKFFCLIKLKNFFFETILSNFSSTKTYFHFWY